MAIGVVEVNDVTESFLECLLGLVFHHDTVAKSTEQALEDVPSVEAANGVLDLPLIIAREDFAYSCWSNTAARLLVEFVGCALPGHTQYRASSASLD